MFVVRRRESDSIPWPLVRGALDPGDLEWLRYNADRLAPIRLTDALRICLIVRTMIRRSTNARPSGGSALTYVR